jgi:hypothetical protein
MAVADKQYLDIDSPNRCSHHKKAHMSYKAVVGEVVEVAN